MMKSQFQGFPPQTLVFLRDLEKNNRRDWFEENRGRYESFFLEPSLAFIQELEKPLAKVAPFLRVEAKKVGGSLMRIYRDTRFSKAKEPYKTNIGIHFRHHAGRDVHAPGCYFHIANDECFFGAGIWMPLSEPLREIRQFIHENPKQWTKTISAKRFAARFRLHEDRLRSMPRGFPKDSPAADAIRLTSFIGLTPISVKTLQSPELVQEVCSAAADARPLMSLLCHALDLPY